MSLKDQGFKFCLSPDAKRARWCHPLEIPYFYADWIDVTDWPADELVAVIELLTAEVPKP